ncbi:MAG: beta-lactamase family protein, partial [Muribaculaceae bacterium]|nr:beta-lactamase family protein [Muribaculaceae bacterium]
LESIISMRKSITLAVSTHGLKAKVYGIAIVIVALTAMYACHNTVDKHDDKLVPCAVTVSLDSLFSQIFPDAKEPGGIAIVMRNDTMVYRHTFGLADLETRAAIDDSTVFNLSSASKIFTTAALLKLSEQGMLSLDDSLSKFFPELNRRIFDKINIRHILTHSTGLPDLRPRNKEQWNNYQDAHQTVFVFGQDYILYGDENEQMHIFHSLETTEFEPGTHYQRDDPAYIMVAPLIERITGVNFEKWMNENIFKPTGANIFYQGADYGDKKIAHAYRSANASTTPRGYRSADGRWDEYDVGEAPYFLTRADRGAYSTAHDFMKWICAFYSGKIISEASLKAMHTPYIPTDMPMISFGLGTGIRDEPGAPIKSYHMNSNGGYAVVEGSWPEKNLHYIVFANRADWDTRAITMSLDSIFHVNNFIR